MKLDGNRESDNIEDRRGSGGGGGGGLGGMLGGILGGRKIGVGSIVIALVASYFLGINPLTVLGVLGGVGGGEAPQVQQGPAVKPPKNDALATFVSKVLADTEDVWTAEFKAAGMAYKPPKLVLFRGSTSTGCGAGQAAMGPFYCPADQRVYIDLGFYETMKNRLGAPGDFAQAYVVAHEIAHHVQNQLGISSKVDAMRGRISEAQQNALSVRLELQADCFAGVWANKSQEARQTLEKGDIEEALNAASQIGDDTLQRKSQGTIQPETFTHGSSAQRTRWFTAGMQSGNMKACDTFNTKTL